MLNGIAKNGIFNWKFYLKKQQKQKNVHITKIVKKQKGAFFKTRVINKIRNSKLQSLK